ncbi:MAG: 4,5-DOPA dioxygenase extradiol [Flavobacteriaceae bacterium]|nr:4,5-DOPA dioxygenase extradiol [Flavobacteriaceae bacterium]
MKRRKFIKSVGISGLSIVAMNDLKAFTNAVSAWKDTSQSMPVIFIGHGAPLYTLDDNKYSNAWKKIGQTVPRPNAILSISAHWLTPGKTLVTASQNPKTIHDFGRIDDRLFEMQYPAPGDPNLAQEIIQTISKVSVGLDHDWGFDHGTWCVLHHMFPDADIPVLQFSIDYKQGAAYHFELASQLSFLRKKGVLIIGSGNIVHNLRQLKFPETASYDWAIEFDETAKGLMDKGDFKSLLNYEKLGRAAQLSIPTPDHYFPLIYALGLKSGKDNISYPIEGISYGSTSMRSVLIQ